jgi:hypothetical protein
LNRKYKCGTWNCVNCKTNFNTKFQLQMHEMECLGDRSSVMLPSTDMLLEVYNALPFVCVHMDPDTQQSDIISPQTIALFNIPPSSLLNMTKAEVMSRVNVHHGTNVTQHDVNEHLFFIVKHN